MVFEFKYTELLAYISLTNEINSKETKITILLQKYKGNSNADNLCINTRFMKPLPTLNFRADLGFSD
jgi:hypothetical protein